MQNHAGGGTGGVTDLAYNLHAGMIFYDLILRLLKLFIIINIIIIIIYLFILLFIYLFIHLFIYLLID